MPLDPAKVALAVQGGLSPVCATCTMYWNGRDRGLPEPLCTSVSGCGSPLVGKAFPDYDGPIKDFSVWCFVCAGPAKLGVRAGRDPRLIGVCKEDLQKFRDLRPVRADRTEPVSGHPNLVFLNGREWRLHELVPERGKTLGELLAEDI